MIIGVFLHIHHEHVASDILNDLRHVRDDYRLFVTHSKPLSGKIKANISRLRINAIIRHVENRGRDILPFLTMLNSHEADGVDLIVKIHTKRTNAPHFDTWSKISYGPLIEPKNFHKISDEFKQNSKLIMLGTKENYKLGKQFDFGNSVITERIFQRIFQQKMPTFWGFFAGTMFWARRDAFDRLLDLDKSPSGFEAEPIGDNGSVAHATERLFGLLPIMNDGYVGTIDAISSEIVVLKGAGNPSMHPMSEDWRRIETVLSQRTPLLFLLRSMQRGIFILKRIRRNLFG